METEKLIQEAERNDSSLFDRIDRHIDLVETDKFVMRKWDGTLVPDVFNQHIPEARLFLEKMIAIIAGMKMDIKVTGDLPDKQRDYIKEFFLDCLTNADEANYVQAKWPFIQNITHNAFLQGWAVAQCLPDYSDGELNMDFRALERRNFVYGAGKRSMAWGAPLMRRSKYDIESEYDYKLNDEFGVVRDYWDKDKEYVFVSGDISGYMMNGSLGQLVAENNNIYGCVPFVCFAAPKGSPLSTIKGIEDKGQSIFFNQEYMFKEYDFVVSMVKTQAYEDLRPALQKPGSNEDAPDHYNAPGSVDVTDVPIQLVPKRDLTNAQRTLQGMILDFLQRAGMSAIMHGNLSFPLSGTAIMQLIKEKSSILTPYLQVITLCLQGMHRMLVRKQLPAMVEGGYMERKFMLNGKEYDLDKLTKPHDISFRFYSEDMSEMVTRASIGQSLRGILPDRVILEEVFERPNPGLDDNQLEREAAERMFPEIMMFEQMHSHIDESVMEDDMHDMMAKMILERLKTALRQMYAQPSPLPAQERPEPLQAPNIMQGGGNAQTNAQGS